MYCGRPARAVWRASGLNGWWIWYFWMFPSLGQGFQKFPTGSGVELAVALFFALMWLAWLVERLFLDRGKVRDFRWDPKTAAWVRGCEGRLINEFREIAREPLPDPSDPRFKKWNARERFPWGWAPIQRQLYERQPFPSNASGLGGMIRPDSDDQ